MYVMVISISLKDVVTLTLVIVIICYCMCLSVSPCFSVKDLNTQIALPQCSWNIHLHHFEQHASLTHRHTHTHTGAIIYSYWARNRHASLLCCLNKTLIYELAVMCEVKYKDSWCWRRLMVGEGVPGGQVGREGEVRRVGVLNDSYKRLPERLLLYSTSAVGYDSARLLM